MIRAELLQDAPDHTLFLNAAPDTIERTLLRILQGPDTPIKRLILDDNYVFQEKHNGDRRMVQKNGDGSSCDFNRNGEPAKGLPPGVQAALRKHPMYQFIVDGELVNNQTFYIFDTLYYGDEAVAAKPYSYRESVYQANFTGYPDIVCVKSASTPQEKIALIIRLVKDFAEGFVVKDKRAAYRPADNNQRYNYRYKFIKELEAVVLGDSTKRVDGKLRDSVRLGCYNDNGTLKDICGATKKAGMSLTPGTVVTLRYLYGTGTLDVVQPRIMKVRDDKAAQACRLDQIVVNKNWRG